MAKRSKIKAVGRLEQVGEAGKRQTANLESGGQEFEISSGAPPSTHLRTPAWPILVCKNGLLKKVLASLYTDMVVIDFNDIDESLKVSLAEGHRAGAEILAHGPTEIFDQRRIDPDLRGQMLLGLFQSCFGTVPIRFERVQSIFEYLI